jgi:hypothetical protein
MPGWTVPNKRIPRVSCQHVPTMRRCADVARAQARAIVDAPLQSVAPSTADTTEMRGTTQADFDRERDRDNQNALDALESGERSRVNELDHLVAWRAMIVDSERMLAECERLAKAMPKDKKLARYERQLRATIRQMRLGHLEAIQSEVSKGRSSYLVNAARTPPRLLAIVLYKDLKTAYSRTNRSNVGGTFVQRAGAASL